MTGKTRIYLAARYSRHDEMCGVRDVLEAMGYEVTSRWIDQGGDALTASALEPDHAVGTPHALRDVEDVRAADVVVVFTAEPSTSGGYHTEFGIAFALGKRLVVVGPRENVFHALPDVEWYPDWARFVMAWTPQSLVTGDAW